MKNLLLCTISLTAASSLWLWAEENSVNNMGRPAYWLQSVVREYEQVIVGERALKMGEIQFLGIAARKLGLAGEKEACLQAIATTEDAMKRLRAEVDREPILRELAGAYAAAGDFKRARKIATRINYWLQKIYSLRFIGEAALRLGPEEETKISLANLIKYSHSGSDDDNRHDMGLRDAAKLMSKMNRIDEAQVLAKKIKNVHRRGEAFASLAQVLAAGGKSGHIVELVKGLKDRSACREVFCAAAEGCAISGNTKEYRQLVQKARDEILEMDGELKPYHLIRLARTQIRSGHGKDALMTIEGIKPGNNVERYKVLLLHAEACLSAADKKGAATKAERAVKTLASAKAGKDIVSRWSLGELHHQTARLLALLGWREKLREWIENIDARDLRVRAFFGAVEGINAENP